MLICKKIGNTGNKFQCKNAAKCHFWGVNNAFRQSWCIVDPPQYDHGVSEFDITFDLWPIFQACLKFEDGEAS